jgi:ABC-type multidrug transport system permease subunit
MKSFISIAKNLKLLFRSNETAFTIIFGPLLIILLVSAAFTGGDEGSTIRVGTYAPEYTPLATTVVESLKDKGYLVSTFTVENECIDKIKTGELHTCVLLPPDFRIKENETNIVTFAVDYSRINLVHQIIEGLSEEFNLQSDAISEEFAGDVLDRVALAQSEIRKQLAVASSIDSGHSSIRENIVAGRSSLDNVDVNVNFTDLHMIRGQVNGLNMLLGDIHEEGVEQLEYAEETLERLQDEYFDTCENCSNSTEELLEESITQMRNATETLNRMAAEAPEKMLEVGSVIDAAAQSMKKVQERFSDLVDASQKVEEGLATSTYQLNDASERLTELRGTLQHLDGSLQQTLGLQASSVASPIRTAIIPVEEVAAEEQNLTYTYPFIIMLVIMFLGLMLSSTLIVMDKTSTASFRNFTTPTRDEFQILMSFVTTFLILLVQTLLILLVSHFFIQESLFNNFGVTLLVIVIAITLFSFLGMIVGYLSGTQEAAMISSLSIGSVLLFISNLVLPLESMNQVVQSLSVYNPYVVLSELLRQSMLFGLKPGDVPGQIALLAIAIVILFLLIIVVQRSFKRRYFQKRSKDLKTSAFTPKEKVVKPTLSR